MSYCLLRDASSLFTCVFPLLPVLARGAATETLSRFSLRFSAALQLTESILRSDSAVLAAINLSW